MLEQQKIALVTIFPKLFESFLNESLVARAISHQLLDIQTINFRDFSEAPHYRVDDTPYGGGAGMVIKAEPICLAVESAKQNLPQARTILLSASGKLFNQEKARELSKIDQLIFVCGRYEGIDHRAVELCIDEELCLGDFVMMGGEVAAMAMIEAIVRLRPAVLGNEHSIEHESFSQSPTEQLHKILEAPQYTKPASFRGLNVPEVLLNGNHEKINKWRSEQAIVRTNKMRPDLIKQK